MTQLVEHHVKYKELHGIDETVWMTNGEHQKLHQKLRKEGKCNIPVEELRKISYAAGSRTDKAKEYSKQYEKTDIRLQYKKQYREDNKEQISEQRKRHHLNNRDELLKYSKQYNKDHKEAISKRKKLYYQDNKDEINCKRRERCRRLKSIS